MKASSEMEQSAANNGKANPITGGVIEIREKPISREDLEAFTKATLTEHSRAIPLTFPTTFRRPEFQWLDRLKVDMHQLLHTDQEYEYLKPLEVGDTPVIRTRICDFKERRVRQGRLVIVVLESEVSCQEELKLRSLTTFVLRESGEGQ
jgi:N-terminal half of MaoC dehydratase